jgi:hypothetical protein
VPTPTSRATTSIAALSGGSNRATALSLNVCPYRAKSVLHRRPLGLFYGGDNYSDAGGPSMAYPGAVDEDTTMNPTPLRFSVVRYQPDMQRQETVNIGVVVFTDAGPTLSLGTNQGKLLALDPNFHLPRLYEHGRRLQIALRGLWEDGTSVDESLRQCNVGGSLSLSPAGMLAVGSQPVEAVLNELLRDLVSPPPRQRVHSQQVSRLHTEVRLMFKRAGLLGTKPDDIAKHLVVTNYPIDPDVGLFAEFALRNTKLHVTETVDFRTSTPSFKKQEAQAKTLLFVEAAERIGLSDLKRYVVVTGASAQVQASMNLLSKYCDDFIVRESNDDWRRYVDAMHTAAMRSEGSELGSISRAPRSDA